VQRDMKAQSFKATVESSEAVEQVIEFLMNWDFETYACRVKIETVGSTMDYKSVFWIWMRHLATSFTERDRSKDYLPDQMHDLLCHKFLGYTKERIIGKTVIKPALRTITYPKDLNRGQFYDLMRNIELWSIEVGVQLPDYHHSQYEEDREKQAA